MGAEGGRLWNAGSCGRMLDAMMRLPEPRYAAALVGRAAVLWLLIRLVFVGFTGLHLVRSASLIIVLVVAVLVTLEARRSGEPVFRGNLGTAPEWIPGLAAATALVLELAVEASGLSAWLP